MKKKKERKKVNPFLRIQIINHNALEIPVNIFKTMYMKIETKIKAVELEKLSRQRRKHHLINFQYLLQGYSVNVRIWLQESIQQWNTKYTMGGG